MPLHHAPGPCAPTGYWLLGSDGWSVTRIAVGNPTRCCGVAGTAVGVSDTTGAPVDSSVADGEADTVAVGAVSGVGELDTVAVGAGAAVEVAAGAAPALQLTAALAASVVPSGFAREAATVYRPGSWTTAVPAWLPGIPPGPVAAGVLCPPAPVTDICSPARLWPCASMTVQWMTKWPSALCEQVGAPVSPSVEGAAA